MTADRDHIEELLGDALGHTGRLQFDGDRYIVAAALLPTVQALIADAEKRAAARALREAAATAPLVRFDNGYPVRAVPVSDLLSFAAAAEGAGR